MKVTEIVASYGSLKSRAIKLNAEILASKKKMIESKELHSLKVKELKEVTENKFIQESSLKIMREVIDKMSKEHINMVQDMLTYALQTIFYDKDYSVKIVLGDKRNTKSAEFVLVEGRDGQSPLESSFDDGVGGGILAVVGFVLQVFYIQYYNLAKIFIMDESLTQVSDEYIQSLMAFIRRLSEKKGFRFVLISHDGRFIEQADKVYLVEDGTVKMIKELSQLEGKDLGGEE